MNRSERKFDAKFLFFFCLLEAFLIVIVVKNNIFGVFGYRKNKKEKIVRK